MSYYQDFTAQTQTRSRSGGRILPSQTQIHDDRKLHFKEHVSAFSNWSALCRSLADFYKAELNF